MGPREDLPPKRDGRWPYIRGRMGLISGMHCSLLQVFGLIFCSCLPVAVGRSVPYPANSPANCSRTFSFFWIAPSTSSNRSTEPPSGPSAPLTSFLPPSVGHVQPCSIFNKTGVQLAKVSKLAELESTEFIYSKTSWALVEDITCPPS